MKNKLLSAIIIVFAISSLFSQEIDLDLSRRAARLLERRNALPKAAQKTFDRNSIELFSQNIYILSGYNQKIDRLEPSIRNWRAIENGKTLSESSLFSRAGMIRESVRAKNLEGRKRFGLGGGLVLGGVGSLMYIAGFATAANETSNEGELSTSARIGLAGAGIALVGGTIALTSALSSSLTKANRIEQALDAVLSINEALLKNLEAEQSGGI